MYLVTVRIKAFLWLMRRQCPESNNTDCLFFFSAYQNNDITEFEKILKTNHSNIMDDPFIREHIEGECSALVVNVTVDDTRSNAFRKPSSVVELMICIFLLFLQSSCETLGPKYLSNSSSLTQEYTSLSFQR